MPFGLHGRRLQGLQSSQDDVHLGAGDDNAVDDRPVENVDQIADEPRR
jgi:hypothetical protein